MFDDNGGSYPSCGVLRATGSCRRVNFRRCGALGNFNLGLAAGHGEILPGMEDIPLAKKGPPTKLGLQPKIKSMKAMIFLGKDMNLFGWLNYIKAKSGTLPQNSGVKPTILGISCTYNRDTTKNML